MLAVFHYTQVCNALVVLSYISLTVVEDTRLVVFVEVLSVVVFDVFVLLVFMVVVLLEGAVLQVEVVVGNGPTDIVGRGGVVPQPLSDHTGPPGGKYGRVAEMSRYSSEIYASVRFAAGSPQMLYQLTPGSVRV